MGKSQRQFKVEGIFVRVSDLVSEIRELPRYGFIRGKAMPKDDADEIIHKPNGGLVDIKDVVAICARIVNEAMGITTL